MHYKKEPKNVHCFFNISIVEMKPQQQHITCVCVLQITCAGNMRFAAASSLIKKSKQSEMLLFKMWMSLLMTISFPTFLHPSHMGLYYQLFRGFLGLNQTTKKVIFCDSFVPSKEIISSLDLHDSFLLGGNRI